MKRLLLLAFACVLLSQAASISLDTAGSDPDLLTPFFTFQPNSGGSYNATYHNISNPPMDFITLDLTAPFTPGFYYGAGGPLSGSSCNGMNAFLNCSISFFNAITTVEFKFFGTDATHPGLPAGGYMSLSATGFDPTRSVGATGTSQPAAIPEPGTFTLAVCGLLLAGLAIGRNQLLKLRVGL